MKKIILGETYHLDLGSLCPVAVIPIKFNAKTITSEYMNSWSGRIEELDYELFEMNGLYVDLNDTTNKSVSDNNNIDKNNIPQIIEEFAKNNIYIDIVCDAYKLGLDVCYRGCVTWLEKDMWKNDLWKEDDCGCFKEWQKAFDEAIVFANKLLNKHC